MNIELNPDRIKTRYTTSAAPAFGSITSAHMFIMDAVGKWTSPVNWEGEWTSPRIVPFQNFNLMPDSDIFNYGTSLFEGGKANEIDGDLYLWRPEMNAERMQRGASRIMLPCPSIDDQIAGMEALLDIDRLYVPKKEDGSDFAETPTYIRPILIGTERKLGVKHGSLARYVIYVKMGGSYFKDPVKLWLQDEFHRGSNAGDAKMGGNYAMHVLPKAIASTLGAHEVLYLDHSNQYLRETGASNIFVDSLGGVMFPNFGDGVLDSNTVKTFLELKKHLARDKVKIQQRDLGLYELLKGIDSGLVKGIGAVGNAACVSPVVGLVVKKDSGIYRTYRTIFDDMRRQGKIAEDERTIEIHVNGPSKSTMTMQNTLIGMQTGRISAPKGWLRKVERDFK